MARLLVPYARSKQTLLRICLEPALALDHGMAHICLARLAYGDSIVDELIQQSVTAKAGNGRERAPHRALEQQWIAAYWVGAGSALPRSGQSRLSSVLNQPMDLLAGSKDDVYAFTHVLMYLTDFGNDSGRLPRARSAILAEAEAALARCLEEQDYDLGGEVLLAWPLISTSWSPAAAFGFRVLARVEDRAGFLPTPNTRVQRLNDLSGDKRTDYLLATSYHAVYVMGLLSATVLRPGRAPPTKIFRRGAVRGSASKILACITENDANRHWREEFDQLSGYEQDALAGLLLNIALYRKVQQREFEVVHKLLTLACDLGLANTPAATQAAELLQRLATFARLTSTSGEHS